MFDDVDIEVDDSPPPDESNNRTFWVAAGILGGITLLALICMAVYALVWVPNQRSGEQTQVAQIETQNAQVSIDQTQAALAARATPTRTAQPTATVTRTPLPPTLTPVVVMATETATPESDEILQDPRTATVAALLTQAASLTETMVVPVATATSTPTTTALPDTGFLDDAGAPALLILAIFFVAVIFLARRMRAIAS